MNPQLRQTEHWMSSQHRTVRWTPITTINAFERVDAMDYIAKGLRALGHALHCEFKYSAIVTNDDVNSVRPEEVLAALSVLHSQVLAAYHTTGLGAAASAGLYELHNKSIPVGAGPKPHDPDFARVLKDVFPPNV